MSGFQGKVNFIWSVADEILRDDFKRSKAADTGASRGLQSLSLRLSFAVPKPADHAITHYATRFFGLSKPIP